MPRFDCVLKAYKNCLVQKKALIRDMINCHNIDDFNIIMDDFKRHFRNPFYQCNKLDELHYEGQKTLIKKNN